MVRPSGTGPYTCVPARSQQGTLLCSAEACWKGSEGGRGDDATSDLSDEAIDYSTAFMHLEEKVRKIVHA